MLTNPTVSETAKPDLVRTYASRAYDDPWRAVEDYERVIATAAEHPNLGCTRLDLPRSRIRPWLDDSMPDCYRALQTALSNGWIFESRDDDRHRRRA